MPTISQSEQLQVDEAFDLISTTTILGTFYGIAFILYCLCARESYLQLQVPDKRSQAKFTLGYISLVLFCATAFIGLNARLTQLAYINYADYPGGPFKYEDSYDPTTGSYQVAGAINIFDLIIEVLTTVIQIWRLWIIWSGTRYAVAVTILPVLFLLSCIALYILVNIARVMLPLVQLSISISTARIMGIAGYAILSTLTILVTGLIIARLLLVRRHHIKLMGPSNTSNPYMSIVTMLTESYAVVSMWSIASAILIGFSSNSYVLFATNDSMVKVIAYFLIVYRVASGRGWMKDTGRKLTSLQWNRGAQTATDEFGSIQFREPATTSMVVAIDSPPASHSESAV